MNETTAPGALAIFDHARALAAVAVLANHLRAFVFVNWDAVEDKSPVWAAFYALTSLGHQAVIVFFVLSGFFISRSVHGRGGARTFKLTEYTVKRVTRLWIVLVPALFMTVVFDWIGRAYGDAAFYDGALFNLLASGPTAADAPAAYGGGTFLANALFLQTIVAPTLGSNGPLWSLAYEFWYYALFGLTCVALLGSRPTPLRLGALGAAALVALWLPNTIVLYGGVWILGWAAQSLSHRVRISPVARTPARLAILGVLAALIVAPRFLTIEPVVHDFALGIAFAIWMIVEASTAPQRPPLRRPIFSIFANASYTLYLTHFPLAALLFVTFLNSQRHQPGPASLLIYCAIFCVLLAFAGAMYWLFERRTIDVQTYLLSRLRAK